MNDEIVKKDPKTGVFVKGNKSASKEGRELARQKREEEKRKQREERAQLIKRVREMRGEEVALEEIEEELSMTDGRTAIKRVEELYKRLMFESALLDDIDWSDRDARTKRKDLLGNLKGLSTLIKEFAGIQQMAQAWEGKRNVPVKEKRRFEENVVDFVEQAKKKIERAEKSVNRE